jgi:hypothetical protein
VNHVWPGTVCTHHLLSGGVVGAYASTDTELSSLSDGAFLYGHVHQRQNADPRVNPQSKSVDVTIAPRQSEDEPALVPWR